MKDTQCKRILRYMQVFGSISTREAFNDLGVARLASRIHDLKEQGIAISGKMETTKNRYGESVSYKRYRLAGKALNDTFMCDKM
jgi:hypothetical protein